MLVPGYGRADVREESIIYKRNIMNRNPENPVVGSQAVQSKIQFDKKTNAFGHDASIYGRQ